MDEKRERDEEAAREMDALFRRADFSADDPGLEARIWLRLQGKLEAVSERELGDDELSELAAAGNPYYCRIPPKKEWP